MSYKLDMDLLDNDWMAHIEEQCKIYKRKTEFVKDPECIKVYEIEDTKNKSYVHLPLRLWLDSHDDFPNNQNFKKIKLDLAFEPQENEQRDQKTVLKEAMETLQEKHSVLLALRTGFGKTYCSFNLMSKIGLKTLVLCFSSQLHPQWLKEGQKWCPGIKIQIVKGEKLDPDADMYIMGVLKATHFEPKVFEEAGIGVVIIDEAHLTYTNTFTSALLKLKPKYLIGLSATPDRKDGMHKLLYPFFGKKNEFIKRHQVKDFTVIKLVTSFKPKISYSKIGKLDWNAVVKSLATNNKRLEMIAKLCEKYKNDRIIILCKRVCTIIGCKNYSKCTCEKKDCVGLQSLIKDVEVVVEGKKGKIDESKRVLIGTMKKLGVGYDSDRTLLIMESDVIDVRQNEGRIRSSNNIIIDIVDDFGTLEKHWRERETWYKKRGATIKIQLV